METREKCQHIIDMFNGTQLNGAKDPLLVKFADGGSKKKNSFKSPDPNARTWRDVTEVSGVCENIVFSNVEGFIEPFLNEKKKRKKNTLQCCVAHFAEHSGGIRSGHSTERCQHECRCTVEHSVHTVRSTASWQLFHVGRSMGSRLHDDITTDATG